MKATVEVSYTNGTPKKDVVVEVPDLLTGTRLLDQIDKRVKKALKDDPDWDGWTLKGLEPGS